MQHPFVKELCLVYMVVHSHDDLLYRRWCLRPGRGLGCAALRQHGAGLCETGVRKKNTTDLYEISIYTGSDYSKHLDDVDAAGHVVVRGVVRRGTQLLDLGERPRKPGGGNRSRGQEVLPPKVFTRVGRRLQYSTQTARGRESRRPGGSGAPPGAADLFLE